MKLEMGRLEDGAPLPEWVAALDRAAFGDAWQSLAPHEALWAIPEVAFARWSRVPAAGEAELLRIAVAPEARGQGLGRVLLEVCQRELAAEGLVRLFLEVRPSNAPALRLYQRCGWEPCGLRPRYYSNGEDALVFVRTS
ncbi:N-acetyltransferase [Geothrix sp. 21YS21S-4]|uniref:GNAT family N-acetyltransferase n=1 Tax=Geothrix sp. 21YS21S-4 TaxID=3068889 RepID=UPI0027B8B27D|nr:GNAT family N-acetyltransferase [Geothrix sp. 21YS21S-4]